MGEIMHFERKRRWPRYECVEGVKAKIYWGHRFLPFVEIRLLDVSSGGFGFVSDRKLNEGAAELRIRSFPNLLGEIIYRREGTNAKGGALYQYGFDLDMKLHKTQLENLGCKRVSDLEYHDENNERSLG